MTVALDEVVRHIRDLPTLSAVVVELLSSIEDEDIDVQTLSAKIALDQSLSAKVLRLANSSFYGMPSSVTTIQQAITLLGFHSIRTLVTACAATASFPAAASGGLDFKAFWRHSVGTAVSARLLAGHLKLNPETAFTAGLLHDIGTLVLATGFPEQYREVPAYRRQHDCDQREAEQAVFGLDHTAAGQALALCWKFPASIQEVVASHHLVGPEPPAPLALLVHSADVVAHALDLSGQEDDQVPPLSEPAWQALPLSKQDWLRLFRDTEAAHGAMCQILIN